MILDLRLAALRRLHDFALPEELIDEAALLILGAFTPLLRVLTYVVVLMAFGPAFAAAV